MDRLSKLQAEVEKAFGVRISDKCRNRQHVDARSVFATLAKRFGYKLKAIGERTGRTHANTINSQRQHKYLPQDTQNVSNVIYEACLTDSESIKRMAKRMREMDYLTDNEKAYRRLTAQQKAVYDSRVSAILKMI